MKGSGSCCSLAEDLTGLFGVERHTQSPICSPAFLLMHAWSTLSSVCTTARVNWDFGKDQRVLAKRYVTVPWLDAASSPSGGWAAEMGERSRSWTERDLPIWTAPLLIILGGEVVWVG
jgi:hypothetical protein